MKTQKLISILQSRIDKRSNDIKALWNVYGVSKKVGLVGLQAKCQVDITPLEKEQKIDRALLGKLYILSNLENWNNYLVEG